MFVRLRARRSVPLVLAHSTSDRQDHFAGQFTGQHFSFMGIRLSSDALSSRRSGSSSSTRLRGSPQKTSRQHCSRPCAARDETQRGTHAKPHARPFQDRERRRSSQTPCGAQRITAQAPCSPRALPVRTKSETFSETVSAFAFERVFRATARIGVRCS